MDIKNLLNRTIINYVLVALGTFLVSKGLIPVDLYDVLRSGLEEGILAALGGAGLLGIIVGAARGITDSGKSKISIGGKSVELKQLPSTARETIVKEVTKAAPETRNMRSVQDILTGR